MVLDEQGLILDEYRGRLHPSGEPGPGDAFYKWVWDNQGNLEICSLIRITVDENGYIAEFPSDPDLDGFDRSDRKFVAVALVSGCSPDVLNAADTDWWHHRAALERNGVRVLFLCPELMESTVQQRTA